MFLVRLRLGTIAQYSSLSPKKIEEGKFIKGSDKLGQERRKTTVEDRLENLLWDVTPMTAIIS